MNDTPLAPSLGQLPPPAARAIDPGLATGNGVEQAMRHDATQQSRARRRRPHPARRARRLAGVGRCVLPDADGRVSATTTQATTATTTATTVPTTAAKAATPSASSDSSSKSS